MVLRCARAGTLYIGVIASDKTRAIGVDSPDTPKCKRRRGARRARQLYEPCVRVDQEKRTSLGLPFDQQSIHPGRSTIPSASSSPCPPCVRAWAMVWYLRSRQRAETPRSRGKDAGNQQLFEGATPETIDPYLVN